MLIQRVMLSFPDKYKFVWKCKYYIVKKGCGNFSSIQNSYMQLSFNLVNFDNDVHDKQKYYFECYG